MGNAFRTVLAAVADDHGRGQGFLAARPILSWADASVRAALRSGSILSAATAARPTERSLAAENDEAAAGQGQKRPTAPCVLARGEAAPTREQRRRRQAEADAWLGP